MSSEMQPSEIMPGALFEGRYQIEATLGEGGMGAVYSALDLKRDQLPCASKVIRAQKRDNERYIQRLDREREVMDRLNHPNIVEVFDVAASAQGEARYLVMPLLEGAPLGDWIKEQRKGPSGLTVSRYLKLMIQALDALDYAHSHGVIHRDIKPDNLYVCQGERAHEQIKVLDFGIAKDLESSVQLTDEMGGAMMGTPRYMSPEQIQGEGIGPQSDIYALTIMIYEQLTGQHPFERPALQNSPDVKGLPAPFRMSWHHMNSEVPPLLELPTLWPILEPALHKAPYERTKSARELRDQLKRWLSESAQDRALHVPVRRPQSFYASHNAPGAQGALSNQSSGALSTKHRRAHSGETEGWTAQLQVGPQVAEWAWRCLKLLIALTLASIAWRALGEPSIPLVDPYLTGFFQRVLSLLDAALALVKL